ncbi:MAG: hypothetical protein IJX19_10830 [Clostridia bacterium]|nr:hypothetical protein [Clostridia bacterium]
MKKKLNELFDQATPRELDGFSDALNAPALSDETLASIKNKVYTKTKLNPEPKRVQKPRTPRMIWLRVGALAACLCLIVTGIFGGVGLLKDHFSDATAPITQHTPDLPLDNYPPDEVDYANMSMVEYMELHPDFLSYRYIPWEEGYAFAHLEILEAKRGYRYIGNLNKDGTYDYDLYPVSKYTVMLLKCRVIEDVWDIFEPGTEINLYIEGYEESLVYSGWDSMLVKLKPNNGDIVYDNAAGEKFYSEASLPELSGFGCFPIKDGKVQVKQIKSYQSNLNWYEYVPCDFSLIESIIAEDMDAETALENMRIVKERYQTGEYNYLSAELVSKMTYGEYCRVIEGTWTEEDRANFGPTFAIEYARLPPLFSVDLSLSDGTTFEFCTRMELSESLVERLMKEIVVNTEAICTDENGKLDAEKCIEMIKRSEVEYSFRAFLER